MKSPVLIELTEAMLTPRLLIRSPKPGDGSALFAAARETPLELQIWMPWVKALNSIDDAEENCRRAHAKFLLREDLRFPIFDKVSGELLGSTGLHRINWEYRTFMIGYWMRSPHFGKGFMTEAVNALTQYAFKILAATRIDIYCNVSNLKSRAIAERLAYPLEGVLKNHDTASDAWVTCRDNALYARTNLEGLPPLSVSW